MVFNFDKSIFIQSVLSIFAIFLTKYKSSERLNVSYLCNLLSSPTSNGFQVFTTHQVNVEL